MRRTMSAHDAAADRFLSDEDLDLANLSWDELLFWWNEFLRQAQASNDLDADEYSHGVFAMPRREWPRLRAEAAARAAAAPRPEA